MDIYDNVRPAVNKVVDTLRGVLASARAMLAQAIEAAKAFVFSRAFVATVIITLICVVFGKDLYVKYGDGEWIHISMYP